MRNQIDLHLSVMRDSTATTRAKLKAYRAMKKLAYTYFKLYGTDAKLSSVASQCIAGAHRSSVEPNYLYKQLVAGKIDRNYLQGRTVVFYGRATNLFNY